MIRLKRSISLRFIDEEDKYVYFDGKLRSISIKNSNLIYSFFQLADLHGCDIEHVKTIQWIEENEISVNTYKRLVESFLKAGILYDDSVISSLDKSRNYSYLSAYDSSIYANKLIEYLKNINILLLGCGTIGSSLFLNLIKLGITNVSLVDKDKVEFKNIEASTLFRKKDVGKYKVDVLYDFAKKENNYISEPEIIKIKSFKKNIVDFSFIEKNFKDEQIDFLFFCIDDYEFHVLEDAMKFADKKGCPLLVTGYQDDETFVMVLNNYLFFKSIKSEFRDNIDVKKSFPINRGIILNATMIAGILTNLVIKKTIDDTLDNQLIIFNSRSLTLKTETLNSVCVGTISSEDYFDNLANFLPVDAYNDTLEKIKEKNISSLTREKVFNALLFSKLEENISESKTNSLFSNLNTDSHLENELKLLLRKISLYRKIKTTDDILDELKKITFFHKERQLKILLQNDIYSSIEKFEEDIFSLLTETKDFKNAEDICIKYDLSFLEKLKKHYQKMNELITPILNFKNELEIDFMNDNYTLSVNSLSKKELFDDIVHQLSSLNFEEVSRYTEDALKNNLIFYDKSVQLNASFVFLKEKIGTIHLKDEGYHQVEKILSEVSRSFLQLYTHQHEANSESTSPIYVDFVLNQLYVKSLDNYKNKVIQPTVLEALSVERSRTIINLVGLIVFKLMLIHEFYSKGYLNLQIYDQKRTEFNLLRSKKLIVKNQKITSRNYLLQSAFYSFSLDDMYNEYLDLIYNLTVCKSEKSFNSMDTLTPFRFKTNTDFDFDSVLEVFDTIGGEINGNV